MELLQATRLTIRCCSALLLQSLPGTIDGKLLIPQKAPYTKNDVHIIFCVDPLPRPVLSGSEAFELGFPVPQNMSLLVHHRRYFTDSVVELGYPVVQHGHGFLCLVPFQITEYGGYGQECILAFVRQGIVVYVD